MMNTEKTQADVPGLAEASSQPEPTAQAKLGDGIASQPVIATAEPAIPLSEAPLRPLHAHNNQRGRSPESRSPAIAPPAPNMQQPAKSSSLDRAAAEAARAVVQSLVSTVAGQKPEDSGADEGFSDKLAQGGSSASLGNRDGAQQDSFWFNGVAPDLPNEGGQGRKRSSSAAELDRPGGLRHSKSSAKNTRKRSSSHQNGNSLNGFWHIEDGLELSLNADAKRRRTTVGKPQTSKGPEEFVANLIANGRCWDEDTRTLTELLEALESRFSKPESPSSDRIPLAQILKSGILACQPVSVQPFGGEGMEITGFIMGTGKISCCCIDCDGDTVPMTAFEEHSGTSERHLSDSITLSNHNVTLMELCNMVNKACGRPEVNGVLSKPTQTLRECSVCKEQSSELLRCGGGCKIRAHPTCAGFGAGYTGPWSCVNCMEQRMQRELDKVEEARARATKRLQKAQERAAENRRASSRLQEPPKPTPIRKSLPKQSSTPRSGSKPQRVHMAAPTAKVGLSQGRMVRNSNKHKRLFDPDEPNGVKDGEKVEYKTSQGEMLLKGEIRVTRDGPCGILCSCCDKVISCSQFEAHAGRGSRRAPYDNIVTSAGITLRRLAAALPSEVPLYHQAEDEQDAVQEDMLGGCVLCDEKNFQRDGFSDLTVILCDQCEREFHVGCLRKHKSIDLEGLPEGDWFCSGKCRDIHTELRRHVLVGPLELGGDYQWQLLHGKDGTHSTTWALKACYEILQESFDPIIDQVSGQDLVKGMVHSTQQGEWDHTGMFAAVLRFKKQPVCSLVMRAFGDMLAEVPLIATRMEARRKGHARYLMNALSDLLAKVGVRTLSLPAAHATVETWTQGFGFQPMAADQLLETRECLRLLVFPGTEVLYKVLLPEAEPYPALKKKAEVAPDAGKQKDEPTEEKSGAEEGAEKAGDVAVEGQASAHAGDILGRDEGKAEGGESPPPAADTARASTGNENPRANSSTPAASTQKEAGEPRKSKSKSPLRKQKPAESAEPSPSAEAALREENTLAASEGVPAAVAAGDKAVTADSQPENGDQEMDASLQEATQQLSLIS